MPKELSDKQKTARGQTIIDVFLLRPDRTHKNRVRTTWGNKTALGVYETMKRLLSEAVEL